MATSIRASGSGLAAVMAQHDRGSEYAFLECTRCPATVRIEDSARLSIETLRGMFAELGWSVQPTLCPACRGRS